MKPKRNLIQLCLLGALLLALPAVVQAQFTFTTNNGTITITGYTGSNGVVMIPGTIADLPVTSIGDWAFYSTSVTNVLIPDSVTNIGDGAFFDCQSLTNVIIGNSVTSIGDWTFAFCTSLTSVCCRGNAPSLVGGNVFYGNLATIYYLSGTTNWGPTFDGHPAVLWNPPVPFTYTTNSDGITLTITGYTGSGGAVTIPSSINFLPVISIGNWAFVYASVTNVLIPNSVTNIGIEAFSYCTSLTSVTIPNSVTSIGYGSFFYCLSLNSITIPNSVTSIGDSAFGDCVSLTDIIIPTSVTNIGSSAFFDCSSLISVSIPNSITEIKSEAFLECFSLTSITIPDSVTDIGDEAFADDTSLTSVTIPDSVTNIAGYVFINCTSLTNITIGNSVASIGYEAFTGCTNLASIAVDPSNSFFSSVAGVLFNQSQTMLFQCPGGMIGGYTVPNSVTNIGIEAFSKCTRLTSVTIPISVTSIGDSAFENCTSLTNVTIPNSVTSIGHDTFNSCISLSSVTIPGSVTNIGIFAFAGCTSLTNVTFRNGINSIGGEAFEYCTSLTSITVPNSVTNIGGFAFAGCASLEGVFFNDNAPGFDDSSIFAGDSFATVYYLPGTTGWEAIFAGCPTALWLPAMQTSDASFGVQTNQFGFNINWASGQTVVVEACTDLANPDWQPVQTNMLTTGSAYFSDSQWTNYPGRFYRLRSP